MEKQTVYGFRCGGPLLRAPFPPHLAPFYLRVAIQEDDPDMARFEGHRRLTAQEVNVIKGNAMNYPVRWKANVDIGRLVGKGVRLKFNMSDARLHAMTFDTADRPLKELPPLTATGSGRAELPVDM